MTTVLFCYVMSDILKCLKRNLLHKNGPLEAALRNLVPLNELNGSKI